MNLKGKRALITGNEARKQTVHSTKVIPQPSMDAWWARNLRLRKRYKVIPHFEAHEIKHERSDT